MLKRSWQIMGTALFVLTICAGCAVYTSVSDKTNQTIVNSNQIPPIEHFQNLAVGTPVPYTTSPMPSFELPPASGGILFLNGMNGVVHVAVSDTMSTIATGYGFLFILPPQTYDFYIYGLVDYPVARSERVEEGKVRYVYLTPLGTGPSRFR